MSGSGGTLYLPSDFRRKSVAESHMADIMRVPSRTERSPLVSIVRVTPIFIAILMDNNIYIIVFDLTVIT